MTAVHNTLLPTSHTIYLLLFCIVIVLYLLYYFHRLYFIHLILHIYDIYVYLYLLNVLWFLVLDANLISSEVYCLKSMVMFVIGGFL